MANAGNPQIAQTPQAGQQPQGMGGRSLGRGMTPMPQGGWSPEQMAQKKLEQGMRSDGAYSNAQYQMNGFNNQPQQAPIDPRAMTNPTGVPEGSYIGPLDRVYKNGEGPQAFVETQQYQSPNVYEQSNAFDPFEPQVQRMQSTQPNIYQQSAGAYTQALGKAATPTAMGDVSQYYNPYESQVVGNTLADIERSRLMAQNQLGAQATQAGAFGGSRQGIAEAETNRAYADQAARTAAQLRQQGYTQAQDIALRDVGVGLQQAQQLNSLSNLGFGMGQGIQQQQMQQGLQQQVLNQALIDAARQQYAGYTGAPMQSLAAPLAALGQADMGQQQTIDTTQKGLLNYLATFASLGL